MTKGGSWQGALKLLQSMQQEAGQGRCNRDVTEQRKGNLCKFDMVYIIFNAVIKISHIAYHTPFLFLIVIILLSK